MNLVALTGPAGSGKSTAADYLVARHGFVKVKFAAHLKAMMRALGLGDREIEGDLKEIEHPLLAGQTPRYAMQTLGTEWGRNIIGENFWVGLWADTACDVLDQGGRVVVDDCRFANEANAVRALHGKVIRLSGRAARIEGNHASENMDWRADIEIDNAFGKAELYGRIDAACGLC